MRKNECLSYFKTMKKKKKKKKGFTLIELLAVIIILGVLMIIAIPSVTEYIQSSRKNAYVTTASQYISGARNKINSAEISIFDTEATYYLPASCISLEKGGDSPFGDWEDAYIVVTYDGFGYDYYWTSRDSSNMGVLLTDEKLLDGKRVQAGITSISTEIGVGDKIKILIINNCNSNDLTEKEATDTIPVDGILEELDLFSERLYPVIKNGAVLDSISSDYVASSTGIDFNLASSDVNGKGVYIRNGTENSKYPVYYYRGDVNNNNIIFANICWKIVRTTETGGIKVIYNGLPIEGKCDNTGEVTEIAELYFNPDRISNIYAGYMYGDINSVTYEEAHKSTKESTSSSIKILIDQWYKTNIDDKGYTEKLEDTIWCNDRSFSSTNTGTGVGTSPTIYAGYERLENDNPQPSLVCNNKNDRFTVSEINGNGALTYPVALLTADEITLAGNGRNGSNSTYLYTGQGWWTMTPYDFHGGYIAGFRMYSSGSLWYKRFDEITGVRPSISLKNNVRYVSGNGSVDDPYVIK